MSILSHLPFSSLNIEEVEVEEADLPRIPVKARAVRPRNSFSGVFGASLKHTARTNFEDSPYDFKKIARAVDTDSYAKQAFGKYRDLFWKEGWTITGENQEAVDYIWRRIALMEQMMGQSFEEFLAEVADQLVKYSNVFIARARADISGLIPELRNIPDDQRSKIVAGFYIIPTESVRIKRNKFNKTISYGQQLTDQTVSGNTADKKDMVTWKAEDVIHLYLDRKPGRAFGTPFVESVLDDITSLRVTEENILNLIDRELHPLYIYKVGTEKFPTRDGEIDEAVESIEALKAEGGLVAPFNHTVEVIGAKGTSLDANPYLAHFKERVAIGLGVSPHHLGMMEGTSNRSVTERLDLALYDKIKNLQSYFENALRLHVINPMLAEAGFETTGPTNNVVSDVCYFDFNEIDIDTQIKKENHYMDLYLKSGITLTELRHKLKMEEDVNVEELFMVIEAQLQAYIQQVSAQVSGQASAPGEGRPDAQKSAPKGQINLPNIQKGTSTKNRPVNQHKRLQSPNVKNNTILNDDFIEKALEFILDEDEENE